MCGIYRKIKATLLSSCCFSEKPAMGNEVETLDYVPGSAIRGILANAYLNNGNDPEELFRGIFCNDDICFPNLYPHDTDIQTYPVPLSIYTCKSKPGFNNDKIAHIPCGAWDLLFEEYNGPKDRKCVDADCGYAALVPVEGFYKEDSQSPTRYVPDKLLITRTAVNANSNSALDASLHSQQELAAGSEFQGVMTAKDEASYNKLIEGLELENGKIMGYTGRRRMGKIKLNLSEEAAEPEVGFLDFPKEDGFAFFALTLLSDAVIVDKLLRPVITLYPDIMKDRQIGFPEQVDVSVIKAFCGKRRISGWHSVAKTFKPDDIAMVKGSTFLMRIEEEHKDSVKQWMEEISRTGIGLRRSEGFGQVSISARIHKSGSSGAIL